MRAAGGKGPLRSRPTRAPSPQRALACLLYATAASYVRPTDVVTFGTGVVDAQMSAFLARGAQLRVREAFMSLEWYWTRVVPRRHAPLVDLDEVRAVGGQVDVLEALAAGLVQQQRKGVQDSPCEGAGGAPHRAVDEVVEAIVEVYDVVLPGEVQVVVRKGRRRAAEALDCVGALPTGVLSPGVLDVDPLCAKDLLNIQAIAPRGVRDGHADAVTNDEHIRLVALLWGESCVSAIGDCRSHSSYDEDSSAKHHPAGAM